MVLTSPSLETSSLSLEMSLEIWSRDSEQKSLLLTATCSKCWRMNSWAVRWRSQGPMRLVYRYTDTALRLSILTQQRSQ